MSSTVPCKYFLRNECRFGANCRFFHPRGGSTMGNPNVGFGNRNLGGQNFNTNQQDVINLSAKSQQNMDAMAEMVKKDMTEWELSKIYPFSSYGPAGGKPSLPGFEDISQEELRFQYLQNNKIPLDLSQQMRNFQQSRINYQQSTPAFRNILERVIVKGEKISESTISGNWGNTAAAPSTQSIFGGTTFGSSTPATQSIFGGSTFGSSTPAINSGPTSGFGVNNSFPFTGAANVGVASQGDGMESTEVNSIFSQQNNPGLFSSQGKSQEFGAFSFGQAFGASQSQTQSFAPTQQPQQLFQTQQPFVQGQQQTGMFGAPNQQNQQIPFQSSQLQSLLQQPPNAFQSISNQPQSTNLNPQQQQQLAQVQTQPFFSSGETTIAPVSSSPSVFGGTFSQPATMPPTNSIFGAPPNQTVGNSTGSPVSSSPSIFGDGFTQPISTTPSNSIFGNAPPNQTSTSIFGQEKTNPTFGTLGSVPVDQGYAYSEESDLTAEELDAFKADHFTIENIPVRPPPKSYCV